MIKEYTHNGSEERIVRLRDNYNERIKVAKVEHKAVKPSRDHPQDLLLLDHIFFYSISPPHLPAPDQYYSESAMHHIVSVSK